MQEKMINIFKTDHHEMGRSNCCSAVGEIIVVQLCSAGHATELRFCPDHFKSFAQECSAFVGKEELAKTAEEADECLSDLLMLGPSQMGNYEDRRERG